MPIHLPTRSTLYPVRRRIYAIVAVELTRSRGLLRPHDVEMRMRDAAVRAFGTASPATVQRYVRDALRAAPTFHAGVSNRAYAAALRAAS